MEYPVNTVINQGLIVTDSATAEIADCQELAYNRNSTARRAEYYSYVVTQRSVTLVPDTDGEPLLVSRTSHHLYGIL